MKKEINQPKHYTPSEVAKLLLVSPVTVRQWSQKGWLKAEHTAGGHRRYLQEEIKRFAIERKLKLHFAMPGKLKIMIIDDDKQLVSFLKELLDGQEGVEEVELSYGGFEAGIKVRDFKPDVILLDLMMPKLDGFSVCRMLKNDPLTSGVRIIAMTGFCSAENERKILAEGAETCLSKPFDDEQLFKILGIGRFSNKKIKP